MNKQQAQTASTYTTDCFRAVKDEDGDVLVKRWVEDCMNEREKRLP